MSKKPKIYSYINSNKFNKYAGYAYLYGNIQVGSFSQHFFCLEFHSCLQFRIFMFTIAY